MESRRESQPGSEPWQIALRMSRDYIHLFSMSEVLNKMQARDPRIMSDVTREDIECNPNSYKQDERLVKWILTTSKATFDIFLEALETSCYQNIAKTIKDNVLIVETGQSTSSFIAQANNGDNIIPRQKPLNKYQELLNKLNTLMNSAVQRNNGVKTIALGKHKHGFVVVTEIISGDSKKSIPITLKCRAYDIFSRSWVDDSYIPNISQYIQGFSLIQYAGLLWIIGGDNHTIDSKWNKVKVLDVAECKWQDFPIFSDLDEEIELENSVILNDRLYAFSYCRDDQAQRCILLLVMNQACLWEEVSRHSSTDDHYYLAAVDNKIYFFAINGKQLGLVYDMRDGSWTEGINSPQTIRGSYATVALKRCIVAITGGHIRSGAGFCVCEEYNPNNNSWKVITRLPEGMSSPSVATDGNRIFVVGQEALLPVYSRHSCTILLTYDHAKNVWSENKDRSRFQISTECGTFVDAEVLYKLE